MAGWVARRRAGLKVGWQAGWQYKCNRLGVFPEASVVPKASISTITSMSTEADIDDESSSDTKVRVDPDENQQLLTESWIQKQSSA
jgi:hypothetical protein